MKTSASESAWGLLLGALIRNGAGLDFETATGRIGPTARGTRAKTLAAMLRDGAVLQRAIDMHLGPEGPVTRTDGAWPTLDEAARHPVAGAQAGLANLAGIAWRAWRGDAPESQADRRLGVVLGPTRGIRIEAVRVSAASQACWRDGQRGGWHTVPDATVLYFEYERGVAGMPQGAALWCTSEGPEGPRRLHNAAIWTSGPGASTGRPLVTCSTALEGGQAELGQACIAEIGDTIRSGAGPTLDEARIEQLIAAGAVGSHAAAAYTTRYRREMRGGAIFAMGRALERTKGSTERRRARKQAEQALARAPIAPLGAMRRTVAARESAGLRAADALVECARASAARQSWLDPEAEVPEHWSEEVAAGVGAWWSESAAQCAADPARGARKIGDSADKTVAIGLGALHAGGLAIALAELAEGTAAEEEAGRWQILSLRAALWRALAAAGPPPDTPPAGAPGWWYVEIEAPRGDEPHAVAMHPGEKEGSTWGSAFWTEGADASFEHPFVISWESYPDGETLRTTHEADVLGVAHVDIDPACARRRARALLEGPWPVTERVRAAIAQWEQRTEVATDITPLWPAETRASERGAQGGHEGTGRATSILALVSRAGSGTAGQRAPSASTGAGGGGARGPLRERQEVIAHWKRQVHGKGRRLRKPILIRQYERGPRPREGQVESERPRR